jgi:hypothetical protein
MPESFSLSCPNRECEADIEVTVTYYAPPEPMTRDYPGSGPEVEIEFSCETCKTTDVTADPDDYSRLADEVLDKIDDAREAALDAYYESKYEELRDREMFGEDY